jgi:hypothetical protein
MFGSGIVLERRPEVQCMSDEGITMLLMVLRCLGVAANQSEVIPVAAAGASRSLISAAWSWGVVRT